MNVKDVISAVVTSMTPTFSGAGMSIAGAVITTLGTSVSDYNKTYVGQRYKSVIRAAGVNSTYYGTLTTKAAGEIKVTLTATPPDKISYAQSLTPILVFDHGHPLEIVNNVKQYSESDTLKYESFPRICLLHDFEVKVTFERNVALDLIIVYDTDPAYTAAQRYTYSFDPILTPLYNLFLKMLADSDYIGTTENNYFKHTKIDRLYWGKNGLYGNTGNIFNDYIDAIEINKLELIINNC